MTKLISITYLLLLPFSILGQVNCNVFKMNNDESCYQACLLATAEMEQGSKESQLNLDKALELCPSLDYAYAEKAVPYLKRGDFITWKKLIDKAVELNPTAHLGYRGWCRFQFLRDYQGAIDDIEKLDSLVSYDIGYCQNGDYHLHVARALCYKALGDKEKAIAIIENQLSQPDYRPWTYDLFHLGVLKFETAQTTESIEILNKSIEYNAYLAEPHYFLAVIFQGIGNRAESDKHIQQALVLYKNGYSRFDHYTEPIDKIYLADIEQFILASGNKK